MSLTLLPGGGATTAPAATALQLIQGGAGATPVVPVAGRAAAAAVGAGAGSGIVSGVFGVALPLLGAFALGYGLGTLLLDAWNYWNQKGGAGTPGDDGYDPANWPAPNPGQVIYAQWRTEQKWPTDPSWQPLEDFGTDDGNPSETRREADAFGPGLDGVWWRKSPSRAEQGPNKPVRFLLRSFTTSDGLPPAYPGVPSTPGADRSNLLSLLGLAPSGYLPAPAVPAAPPLRPVEPYPREPERRPMAPPGQPVRIPPAVDPVPGPGVPAEPAKPGDLPDLTPGPGTKPQPSPGPAPVPNPDPDRPPLPVRPDGLPGVPAKPPVPVTPPDVVIEGGLPVGDASQRPRPDLDSIARELGRQEQKMAGLLTGLGGAAGLADLIELLLGLDPGGAYVIQQACGTGPGGQPLPPVTVPIAPALNSQAAIINRLDAIAELLDIHKQLRQPVCKGKPVGQPVTVTFAEIDP